MVTDGRGSPRDDLYKDYTNEQMRTVRIKEQKKAAIVGEFARTGDAGLPQQVRQGCGNLQPVEDLVMILLRMPVHKLVYTHNLADKHDTHVGGCAAQSSLPSEPARR